MIVPTIGTQKDLERRANRLIEDEGCEDAWECNECPVYSCAGIDIVLLAHDWINMYGR